MLVGEVREATTGDGLLLEIIRRQPVFLCRDESFEEAPGLARRSPKEGQLLRF